MFERFAREARRTMHNSKRETDDLGYPRVDTEHILLALTRDAAFANHFLGGISVTKLRDEIFARIPRMPPPILPRDIPLTKAARQALECAVEEADKMQDTD